MSEWVENGNHSVVILTYPNGRLERFTTVDSYGRVHGDHPIPAGTVITFEDEPSREGEK